MDKLVEIFADLWKGKAPLPVVFFFIGTALLLLSSYIESNEKAIVSGSGIFFCSISVCLLMARLIESQDEKYVISRQMFDGFLAGLVAGCSAGTLGFGVQSFNTAETLAVRSLVATVYSVAIGGVVGLIFIFVQSRNRGVFSNNFAACSLVLVATISITIYISSIRMPVFFEGIRGWEVYIIFSTFCVVMVLLRGLSERYRTSLILSRSVLTLLFQLAFLPTLFFIPAPLPEQGFSGTLWGSTIYEGIRGSIAFAYLIVSGIIVQAIIYYFATEDIAALRHWDRLFYPKMDIHPNE